MKQWYQAAGPPSPSGLRLAPAELRQGSSDGGLAPPCPVTGASKPVPVGTYSDPSARRTFYQVPGEVAPADGAGPPLRFIAGRVRRRRARAPGVQGAESPSPFDQYGPLAPRLRARGCSGASPQRRVAEAAAAAEARERPTTSSS